MDVIEKEPLLPERTVKSSHKWPNKRGIKRISQQDDPVTVKLSKPSPPNLSMDSNQCEVTKKKCNETSISTSENKDQNDLKLKHLDSAPAPMSIPYGPTNQSFGNVEKRENDDKNPAVRNSFYLAFRVFCITVEFP